MYFRIADTFTDSLARLTGEEQKAVKTTAFDLQLNPTNPGFSFHKLDRARDKNFWSVRISGDLRLIVHKTEGSLLLCYVDHHDKAYAWAASRKLETHPTTGAAQLVEVRETVQDIFVPNYITVDTPAPQQPPKAAPTPRSARLLFAKTPESELLAYGVPVEWIGDVLQATEDSLFALAEHLPREAAEALLELAVGGKPSIAERVPAPSVSPFDHPDALRRFRVVSSTDELAQALDFPWDKWMIFLHPEQRQWVERDYSGPARISGSAGTGKTIVALHRAVYLTRNNPDARVLLTTFSDILANALRVRLRRLISSEPQLAERLDIHALDSVGLRLYKPHFGAVTLATTGEIRSLIEQASALVERHRFSLAFLVAEWEQVVDAWQLQGWEAYRDVARLGRKTRLPEPQRALLWQIFEQVRAKLDASGKITYAMLFQRLTDRYANGAGDAPYDFAIVDEAQDISIPQLRFLASFGASQPNTLFFAGDIGQRIFQQPFSWKALGVDVRGRSRTLRVNYRTSHQIRSQADRLLEPQVTDADGNVEGRSDTISVFDGPAPLVRLFDSQEEEQEAVAQWLKDRLAAGVALNEIGLFVRSAVELDRARAAATQAGISFQVLDERVESLTDQLAICTMHLAKGLEFRAVVVMACDDEIIPLQERIESVTDQSDLEEVYNTERHLLYVACTRARDFLLITSTSPSSEFLDDLLQ
jgi:superfamily I DNA/RNA helicase/mRNA-degrading endonuclease RelE of RelBE toxin-antitoxin system